MDSESIRLNRMRRNMNKFNENSEVRVIGIDLGKYNFQLWGVNKAGKVLLDKQLSRRQLRTQLAQLQPCLIGLEACSTSHYWARLLRNYGHDVRLIPPQFVKPYVKSNKNDRADAEAICEAIQRPRMRFVAIKEVCQQDIQSLHRIRSRNVANRTAHANQIRGLLMEYGIELPQGRRRVRGELPRILEDAENGLTPLFRELLFALYEDLIRLDTRIEELDRQVTAIAKEDDRSRRLMTIPGVGPLGATALLAAIGDINTFKNGRELAAWVGLVPRQHSTGGKERLLGISKRGDVYLRQLLIHGARAAIRTIEKKHDKRSRCAQNLLDRRNRNVAAVAMANKTVRTAYALLKNGGVYHAENAILAR